MAGNETFDQPWAKEWLIFDEAYDEVNKSSCNIYAAHSRSLVNGSCTGERIATGSHFKSEPCQHGYVYEFTKKPNTMVSDVSAISSTCCHVG